MKRKIAIPALLAALGIAAAGGFAYSQQVPPNGGNDAIADLANVRVSLAQAAVSAEQYAGGRATRAQLERNKGVPVFNVEVVTAANTVMDVTVDADGRVVAATLDTEDASDVQENGEKEERTERND